MSDYDDIDREIEERNRLIDEYNNLVSERNSLASDLVYEKNRYNYLSEELGISKTNCQRADALIRDLTKSVVPGIKYEADFVEIQGGKSKDAISALDEIKDTYIKAKNQATATKNITLLREKYYMNFGQYKKLRDISLGYVVGLDEQMWTTDTSRKVVEKAYLESTPYWLSYATMATMLWASDDPEASDRAMRMALQLDIKKASLYFMLVNLRFERQDAAKQWYSLYFSQVTDNDITDELQYILQAILCGAMGNDKEFEEECLTRIYNMFETAKKKNPNFETNLRKKIRQYYNFYSHATRNEYIMMGRGVTEYKEMIDLLSQSEKNQIFFDHFSNLFDKRLTISDTLSRRIENSLCSLINSYDKEEKVLLDKIKYEEFVIKAKGDIAQVQKNYKEYLNESVKDNSIGSFLAEMALSTDHNVSIAVRKFALTIIGKYCKDSIRDYAQAYRKKEQNQYEITVDDFVCKANEKDTTVERKLKNHYEKKIREAIKGNKVYRNSITFSIVAFMVALILGFILFKVGGGFKVNQKIALALLTIIVFGVGVGLIYCARYQKEKIREKNKKAIKNGIDYLKEILEEMQKWRNDYHNADSINDKIIELFEKEVSYERNE